MVWSALGALLGVGDAGLLGRVTADGLLEAGAAGEDSGAVGDVLSPAHALSTRPVAMARKAVRRIAPLFLTRPGRVGRLARGTPPCVTSNADGAEVKVDLPADLTAASAARAEARRVLPRWRLAGLLDPVLLVVSELVGNAVRHGRPPVDLRLRKAGRGVRVDVHDEASAAPALVDAGESAESGRGLLLVDAVATDSGVEQIEGDGKVVWAQVEPEPDQR